MKDKILKDFKTHAKKIWGNSKLLDQIDFTCEISKRKNMMSLAYTSRPEAVTDTLYRVPTKMKLYISKKALKLPKDQFQQLLKHEAIHIGHSPHDWQFRRVAEKHGIPMSVSMSEGGGYQAQIKIGSRYKTIQTHSTLEEARAHAKKLDPLDAVEDGKNMGMFIDPNAGRKGKLIKLDERELIGTIKKPKNGDVWIGFSESASGNRIPRLMTEEGAKEWSKKTGKNVWKKMKIWELREL